MCDAKEYALKKPCYWPEREVLNTTGAWRVPTENHAHLEIKSAPGMPVLQMGDIFPCCYSIKTQPMAR